MIKNDEELKLIKREYYRKYREKNKERINQKHREWRNTDKGKMSMKKSRDKYWENKVAPIINDCTL